MRTHFLIFSVCLETHADFESPVTGHDVVDFFFDFNFDFVIVSLFFIFLFPSLLPELTR